MKSVLICDDESRIRLLYKVIFEEQGWTVYTAKNGLEGLKLAMQHSKTLDLIVSDQNMNGTYGTQLYRDCIKHNISADFYLMSGDCRPVDYSGNFVMKPFQCNEKMMELAKEYQVKHKPCKKRSREIIKYNNEQSRITRGKR